MKLVYIVWIAFVAIVTAILLKAETPKFQVTVTELGAACYSMPVEFNAKFCDVTSPATGTKYAVILIPSGGAAINRK